MKNAIFALIVCCLLMQYCIHDELLQEGVYSMKVILNTNFGGMVSFRTIIQPPLTI